jgi:RNA polymerase sigma-70 factor (ECF subfamily)
VALNSLLTHHRRTKLRRTSSLDDLPPASTPADDPHHRHDAAESLHLALNRLEPLERTLIALHLEGFDYPEISDVTGLTPGAVGVRIHRIRKRLISWIGTPTP